MQEREQILYVQTRIMQMASERWHVSINRVAALFRQYGIADMIEEDFELYHTEGDEAIYADIETLLKHKEANVCKEEKDIDGQSTTSDKIMNAVNLVAAMAVSEIARKRNEPLTQTLLTFMASRTAGILYDTQTRLWCDGPAAVTAAYLSETEGAK